MFRIILSMIVLLLVGGLVVPPVWAFFIDGRLGAGFILAIEVILAVHGWREIQKIHKEGIKPC